MRVHRSCASSIAWVVRSIGIAGAALLGDKAGRGRYFRNLSYDATEGKAQLSMKKTIYYCELLRSVYNFIQDL